MATKTGELREMLIASIEDVRSRKMDADEGKAVASLAAQVNASLQVEINAMKALKDMGVVTANPVGTLALGETSQVNRETKDAK